MAWLNGSLSPLRAHVDGIGAELDGGGPVGAFRSIFLAPTISADNVGGNSRRRFFGGKTDSSPPIRGGHRLSPPSSPLDERRRAAYAALKQHCGSSSNCRQDWRLLFGAIFLKRAPVAGDQRRDPRVVEPAGQRRRGAPALGPRDGDHGCVVVPSERVGPHARGGVCQLPLERGGRWGGLRDQSLVGVPGQALLPRFVVRVSAGRAGRARARWPPGQQTPGAWLRAVSESPTKPPLSFVEDRFQAVLFSSFPFAEGCTCLRSC